MDAIDSYSLVKSNSECIEFLTVTSAITGRGMFQDVIMDEREWNITQSTRNEAKQTNGGYSKWVSLHMAKEAVKRPPTDQEKDVCEPYI